MNTNFCCASDYFCFENLTCVNKFGEKVMLITVLIGESNVCSKLLVNQKIKLFYEIKCKGVCVQNLVIIFSFCY